MEIYLILFNVQIKYSDELYYTLSEKVGDHL